MGIHHFQRVPIKKFYSFEVILSTMSTGGSKASSGGKSPAKESVVAGQMNTWLKSLYDYYAGGTAGGNVAQTMHKVIVHLESITEHLRASYPAASSGSAPQKNVTITGGQAVVTSSENKTDNVSSSSSSVPPATTSATTPSNQRLECRICLESVSEENGRKFALLEQCDHPYCEPCVRSLLEHNGHGAEPIKCPTCRSLSARIVVRDTFLSSGPEKAALFGSLLCCPPHQIATEHRSHSEDNEAFELVTVADLEGHEGQEEEEDFFAVADGADMIVVDEDDWNAFFDYTNEDTDTTTTTTDTADITVTTSEDEEDSAPTSSSSSSFIDDSVDLLDFNRSPPSYESGGPVHSVELSMQIDGRPFNVILDETAELLDTWSLDDDSPTETVTVFSEQEEEDVVTSYSSSDEETDHSFSF